MLHVGRAIVGDGAPCYVVAEAGVNHNGDVNRALKMVRVAKESGANAIKFQSFNPEDLATATAPLAAYQKQSRGRRGTQIEMLRHLALNENEQEEVYRACKRLGFSFFRPRSTRRARDFLQRCAFLPSR